MSYSEWAYDDAQAIPAQLVSTSTSEIDALVDGARSDGTYRNGTAGDLNVLDVYPVSRTGAAPDQWYNRDQANDAFAYVPGDGGQLYEISQAFAEMSYAEAKAQARNDLEAYYQAYSTSQFTAGGNTFSASGDQLVSYLVIDTIITKDEAAGGYTGGQFVFDMDGDANPVDDAATWGVFWNKYEGLFNDARNITLTAWTDVRNATTTDEVRNIIAALPAIPGA